MFCYNCGCHLSEHDYCTACGADVALYKKIMAISNLYFNQGLERAGVRDLSGAINSLRQSLKFNKNNIEARNLLGLVYFEMGEAVAAISEWVISQNIRSEKNLANEYLKIVQSSSSKLDTINQTIRKYNQAYTYCVQDNKDLAVIQLKRVLGLNPKFVKAHQLLALLYLDMEEYDKADKELDRALQIDVNNTLCLRYKKEVETALLGEETEKHGGLKKKEETLRYERDNEVIIQPIHGKTTKSSPLATIFNMIIGILIGAAAVRFLMVPAVKSEYQTKLQEQTVEYGNKLDKKTAEIQTLNSQIATLQGEKDDLKNALLGYEGEDGAMTTIDNLLMAATVYLETGDIRETALKLEAVTLNTQVEECSESFQKLYHTILAAIGPELSEQYREEGFGYYRTEDYIQAVNYLEKAVYYDESNGQALYDLANTYRKMENVEMAKEAFQKLEERFPDTEWARRAADALKEYEMTEE